jgi:hypothetical protein
MLFLPLKPELAQFNWERISQQWNSLTLQTKTIADGAGQGEEFKALEQQVSGFVVNEDVAQLNHTLLKRKGVRVLTQLWIDKEEIRKGSLNEETIDYAKQQTDIQALREQLKGILSAALSSPSAASDGEGK